MSDFNMARLHGQTFYTSVYLRSDKTRSAFSEINALNFIASLPLVRVHSFIADDGWSTMVLEISGNAVRLVLQDDLPGKGAVAQAIGELAEQLKVVHNSMRLD